MTTAATNQDSVTLGPRAHARIDDRVQHIGDQIPDAHQNAHEQHERSEQLRISAPDRLHREVSDALVREDPLDEHRSGTRGSKYLRSRRPVELLYQRRIGDRSLASQLEYRVRKLARAQKDDTASVDALVDRFLSPDRG